MTLKAAFRLTAIALVLIFCHALPSFAVSSLSISPLGSDVYDLQGTGMADVAALDITITYDVLSLANPRITQGNLVAGAMIAVNPNLLGTIRIAIVTSNPIRGTGDIATLAFNKVGTGSGGITSLRANITTLNGTQLPVVTQINNPTSTANSTTTSTNQGSSTSTISDPIVAVPSVPYTGGNRTVIGGVITPPTEIVPVKQEPPAVTEPIVEKIKETPFVVEEVISKELITTQPDRVASKEKAVYTQKSVLERFRELKGERTPKILSALFNQESLIGFKQEPSIILSDGKSAAKVVFIALLDGKGFPDVNLKNARLISLSKDPEKTNTWIAEIRPDKGVNSAALTVLQDKVTMIFPLTVASKMKIGTDRNDKVTETDFNKFLKAHGSASKPRYDLNNDGKLDYVDDYIFTANYLTVSAKIKK